MKTKFFLIILCLPILLFSNIIRVEADGEHQYETIQSAITSAVDGDTVLVYPGSYYGVIDFQSKNIVLASLEMITGKKEYIASTIIDGNNTNYCIKLEDLNYGIIRGFTIKKGFSTSIYSSGINIILSENIKIINCDIKNNQSKESGAGIRILNSENILFSGLSIHNNRGSGAGGIYTYQSSDLIFDNKNKCSVYNNIGHTGVDIFFYWSYSDINVIVDTVTVENPDLYYIDNFSSDYEMTLDYDNFYFEEIDQDLYVSPEGNDSNDGLTEQSPFKTIQKAVYSIKSNPNKSNTIYLADGIYSKETNNEIFPIGSKSNISFEGENNTEIHGDDWLYKVIYFNQSNNVCLENLSFIPKISTDVYYSFQNCYNLILNNINFCSNNNYIVDKHLYFGKCKNAEINNIKIEGILAIDVSGFYMDDISGKISNLTFDNNEALGGAASGYSALITTGYSIVEDNGLIMNNSIFKNSIVPTLYFKLIDSYFSNGLDRDDIILNNLLFINNSSREIEKNFMFCFGLGPDPTYMNNCAFINNHTVGEWSVGFAGNFEINNSIFHNDPLREQELVLAKSTINTDYPYPTKLVLNNCALNGGNESYFDQDPENNEIIFNNTINSADYSLKDLFTYEDSTDYLSYQLIEGSPLINSGYYNEESFFPEKDLLGNERIWDEQIDIGPFEYGSLGTEVEEDDNVPPITKDILMNYPNPFSPCFNRGSQGTNIKFKIPRMGRVKIEVFNIKGRKVRTLKDATMQAGEYELFWEGYNSSDYRISSGVYFCKLSLDDEVLGINKMLLVK